MMQLKSLAKADSINGSSAFCFKKLLSEILKEAKNVVFAEACKKVLAPLMHIPAVDVPHPVLLQDAVEVRLAALPYNDASRIVRTAMNKLPWLDLKSQAKGMDGSVWTFSFNPKFFSDQVSRLKKFDHGNAVKALSEAFVRISFCGRQEKTSVERNVPSTIRPGSLSLEAFGIRKGKAYTKSALDKTIDGSIQKTGSAAPIVNAVLALARSSFAKFVLVSHPMTQKDISTAESELRQLAFAVSALHCNPKLSVVFNDRGFVLYFGKRPVGRMGKVLAGKTMLKDAVKMCEAECGKRGNSSKLLDVLDAEGMTGEDCLAELFNDLVKHIQTHSSGAAAKAAKRLALAAGIKEQPSWQMFSSVVEAAAEEIRSHRSHPFITNIKDAVTELNRGRGVVDPRTIKWEVDIVQNRLDWLGAVMADVLEDEVARNSRAVESLSCTIDWLQNVVQCALSIKYQGSEGIRVSFQPCGKIVPRKWRLELQDIMKSGPKWSEI